MAQGEGGGRPTKFRDEYVDIAKRLAKLGLVDQEMADALGINVRTLYAWKHEHRKFSQALKIGKRQADDRVERSLYHRAIGYEHPDEEIRTEDGSVIAHSVKRYPPDTTAAIFWLKNRRPDQWRDKTEVEMGVKGLKKTLDDLEEDDRAEFARKAEQHMTKQVGSDAGPEAT